MTYNLQPSYSDVSELTTSDKAIVVLYGRFADGTIIPVQVNSSGVLATSGGGGGGGISPSANAFFADQTNVVLTGTFTSQSFGFISLSISLFNDDPSQVIEFSFNGTTIHGRVKVGEALAMDYRAQSQIYLRTVSGSSALYRVSSY